MWYVRLLYVIKDCLWLLKINCQEELEKNGKDRVSISKDEKRLFLFKVSLDVLHSQMFSTIWLLLSSLLPYQLFDKEF